MTDARSSLLQLLPRMLVVVALNTVIATALTVFGSQHDSFKENWIYSECIGLSIWLLIDRGRYLIEPQGRVTGLRLLMLTLVGALAGYVAGAAVADLITGRSMLASWSAAPRMAIGILLMSMALGLAGSLYFSSRALLADARTRAEAAQRQASEARLRLLETQLEPHMLFNTLANLQALITVDPPAAQRMLDRLIAYLRATLAASRAGSHPLAAEFERLRDYLELMAVRMGTRLRYTLTLPEALRDVPIPPLLLQPLVENAIRHGLEPKITGGCIEVAAQRDGDTIRLTVTDDGLGRPQRAQEPGNAFAPKAAAPADSGFGLDQVSERLATSFGPRAQMNIGDRAGGGTIVSLTLPADAGTAT
ncbi:MAG: sensor histidine kinase [Burkholderiaceae bacterium]